MLAGSKAELHATKEMYSQQIAEVAALRQVLLQ